MDDNFIILLQKSLITNGFIISTPLDYNQINFVALPNSKHYSYEYDDKTRNDEKAVMQLTKLLFNYLQTGLKFIPLPLQDTKIGLTAYLCRHENILARFSQSKIFMSDENIYRWDVLVLGRLK